jgi:ABC-2 type transport system ATP-binding protein
MAVNQLSFSIEQGESVSLIGPNGSGKSTTIKMMTGILYPSSGSISVLGLDPTKSRRDVTQKIGCVFGQKSNLWFHLPARDSFQLLKRIYGISDNDFHARLAELITAFEIENVIDLPVRQLSLGQRMRCEIVSCLLHRPEILFLDEPTIGLDVLAKGQIRNELMRLNKEDGATIFLTSHDAGDIDVVSRRTIVINEGEKLFDGSTEELKAHYVHQKKVEVSSEPSMEEIIAAIYRDAYDSRKIGRNE